MLAVYDLGNSPATFDFVHWLANAEAARIAAGAESITVRFVPGDRQITQRDYEFTPERKAWRLHNLLVPLCRLLPSVTAYEIGDSGEQSIGYSPKNLQSVCLRATEAARDLVTMWARTNKSIVTITLRQSDFQVKRNSNRDAWLAYADELRGRGILPVIIPDTEAVLAGEDVSLGDHRVCIPAALEPDLRLALYERALVNLLTSGGPYALALYAGAPFVCFKLRVDGIRTCSAEVLDRLGFGDGRTFGEHQLMMWDEDTVETIRAAADPIIETLKNRPRPLAKLYVFAAQNERRIANIKASMARGLPTLQRMPAHDRTLAIVGYGPSLQDTWRHLAQTDADICSTSGAHRFLLTRGIIPDLHVETDPRPHKMEFIRVSNEATRYLIASCCAPEMFDHLAHRRVEIWHAWEGDEMEQLVTDRDPNAFLILGGSNVGLRALALGTALGYRKFDCYGFDCSLSNGERHAGEHGGKRQKVFNVRVGNSDRYFDTTAQLASGAREFIDIARKLIPQGYEINVIGDGMLPAMLAEPTATQAQEVA